MNKKILQRTFGLLFLLLPGAPLAVQSPDEILVLRVEGIINPVVSQYITNGIKKAEETSAAALLIELDTPGGLLDATRTSISAMINTRIPVIIYVAPRGARATSAGVFLTMAADVAAMAPETHIGAAHPVTITGENPAEPAPAPDDDGKKDGKKKSAQNFFKPKNSVMEEKMVSDAAAYIRALAEERGRNADWAERAVRESVSLTATEAIKQNVADLIAESKEDLVRLVNGRSYKKAGQTLVFKLVNPIFKPFDMTWSERILHGLAHPNVAYILMTIGFYGLVYELAAPGFGLGGIAGVICLMLAFFSLQVIPINAVGLVLLIFGAVLMIMELFTPTHGVLTIGGLVSFAIGSFLLIDVPPVVNFPRVSLALIIPNMVVSGLFFGLVVRKIISARRMKPNIGLESLVGRKAEARESLAPDGLVFLDGELWSATSQAPVQKGSAVEVIGVKGNVLLVKKID